MIPNRARTAASACSLAVILTVMLAVLAARASAQLPDTARSTHRAAPGAFCFRGQPLAACRRYFVFEITGAKRIAGTSHTSGTCFPGNLCRQSDLGNYLAWDVGAMANVDSTHAFGVSGHIGGADPGGVRAALKARTRVWLPHHLTLDAAAGPLMAQQDPNIQGGARETYGGTVEAGVGVADLATVLVSADAVTGARHGASAVYLGGRLGAHAGVAGTVVVAVLTIGLLIALSRGLD